MATRIPFSSAMQPFYNGSQGSKQFVDYVQMHQESTTFIHNGVYYFSQLVQGLRDENLYEVEA